MPRHLDRGVAAFLSDDQRSFLIEELVALVSPLVLWVPGVASEIAEALVKPRVSRSLAMLEVTEAWLARSVRVVPVCLPLTP